MLNTEESAYPICGTGLPELELVARRDLGETPEVKEHSLALLKQLITGDERLHCPADDAFLVKYLRARKYRVAEAFEMIRNYFRSRLRLREFFDDLSPDTVPYPKLCVENRLILVSKLRDPQGRAVVMMKFGEYRPRPKRMQEFWFILVTRRVQIDVQWGPLLKENGERVATALREAPAQRRGENRKQLAHARFPEEEEQTPVICYGALLPQSRPEPGNAAVEGCAALDEKRAYLLAQTVDCTHN
ncbi:hypothetical protein HPB48_002360 [Haemaphysalis longicornis]|uniref:CRAL/TRIO N-terminal domain-containing protein n=1 Tax=Haemaphysalis longicornis TaxID=44386 RepID=A0A9J6GHC4_HAELO|nr:hypothetical protein HPB48_002360 [Haemaphysalis longicornis]